MKGRKAKRRGEGPAAAAPRAGRVDRDRSGFATVEEAVRDIADGRMVIVVDYEERENEGDLTIAAEKVSPEIINFMARYGRGLICLPMTGKRLQELQVPLMVEENTSTYQTAFCVSIEARKKVSTGISARDRAETVRAAVDPATRPEDLARPGHVFPIVAQDGGVLRRAGHTEAAVDLARLAGLYPAGVLCEILADDGTMAKRDRLLEMSREFQMPIITIEDLIRHRRRFESFIPPGNPLFACRPHHPASKRHDESGFLGHRNELFGADDVAGTGQPADQGFQPHHPAAGEIDLGLVHQHQLVLPERLAQAGFQAQLLLRHRIQFIAEIFETAAPLLRLIHRQVCLAQQGIGVEPVVRIDADADAGADGIAPLTQFEGFGQRLGQLARHPGCSARSRWMVQDDGKLIAP